jgi:hypothetical protein
LFNFTDAADLNVHVYLGKAEMDVPKCEFLKHLQSFDSGTGSYQGNTCITYNDRIAYLEMCVFFFFRFMFYTASAY